MYDLLCALNTRGLQLMGKLSNQNETNDSDATCGLPNLTL